jgi:hypothetical protein
MCVVLSTVHLLPPDHNWPQYNEDINLSVLYSLQLSKNVKISFKEMNPIMMNTTNYTCSCVQTRSINWAQQVMFFIWGWRQSRVSEKSPKIKVRTMYNIQKLYHCVLPCCVCSVEFHHCCMMAPCKEIANHGKTRKKLRTHIYYISAIQHTKKT